MSLSAQLLDSANDTGRKLLVLWPMEQTRIAEESAT